MASISKTVRPKRSNNNAVSPTGYGLTVGRGTPNVTASGSGGTLTDDGFYISTYESTDSNTVLAEDFTRGHWYTKDYDTAVSSGGLGQTGVHGWGGTIYANPITPAGAVATLGGGEYAGTSGVLTGGGSRNMADHTLKTTGITEIWVRFYTKPLSGYGFGAEKMLTFNAGNAGVGGIYWAGVGCNIGSGSASSTGSVAITNNHGSNVIWGQNQGNAITMSGGTWYFMEWHLKLNDIATPNNGEVRLWMDACGTGTLPVNPAGTPTLRMQHTNVGWGKSASSAAGFGSLWFENWSNPGSTGERYLRSIHAKKAGGPIGFAPTGIPGGTA